MKARQIAVGLSAICIPLCSAVPVDRPQNAPLTPTNNAPKYVVTSQTPEEGPPVVVGDGISGTGGTGVVTTTSTYSVGVTVEVGVDLGLDFDEIVEAGVHLSVATTTEQGTETGAQKTCPNGPWICSLFVTPPYVKVTGTLATFNTDTGAFNDPAPWTVHMPATANNAPAVGIVDICACQNFAHWADNGAPSVVCPQPCGQPLG